MKIYKILFPVMLGIVFLACKPKADTNSTNSDAIPEESEEFTTYAEIAHKTGGRWEDRKYIGGDFQNVSALTLPEEHTDHSYFIRYEGPGWESSKVGYRLYLDWRNAIDIFGKTKPEKVLDQVGLDGFDSYHEMSDWGMDILKVGKGLGIGSVGRLSTVSNEVLHFKEVDQTEIKVLNESNMSGLKINYQGWKTDSDKIDLTSELTIATNERKTKHTLTASKEIQGLCTGIVKLDSTEVIRIDYDEKKWACIATYGVQTLVPDRLGMAIFYNKNQVQELVDGQHDHLIVFKPNTDAIQYYFAAAWEQEPGGITNQEEFKTYLQDELNQLNK